MMDVTGLDLRDTATGCRLLVKVKPGAKQDVVTAVHAGRLKMTVVAPPERGKANTAVARVLAGVLNLATSRVEVVSGFTHPEKVVAIHGCRAGEVRGRLERMPRISTGRPLRTG